MKNLFILCLTIYSVHSSFAQASDSANFYYQKGLQDKNSRLWMIAINDFQKSLQFQPSNLVAQRELGKVEVELRKYDQAKETFKKLYDVNANDSIAVENLAMLYYWNRQWQECALYASRAKALQVGKGWNYLIGKSYYELEDFGQACKFLQAASKEDSSNAEIPYLMARSYVEMNNYKTAVPYFQHAIALDSSKYQWMYECALTMSTNYDDKSAIKYYELAATKGYKKDNDFY
ncbi:MAG TPA: tetratricopeptide repeat protein, partial [Puia sp.]|nr:tetratricopeptide repeat protein [Puia sp.]